MALFLAMEHLSGCPFWLPCQKACPSGDTQTHPVLPPLHPEVSVSTQHGTDIAGSLPVGFLDQDGPKDVFKESLLLPVRRLHKGVQGSQGEALLVQFQKLGWQVPQRG